VLGKLIFRIEPYQSVNTTEVLRHGVSTGVAWLSSSSWFAQFG
jgi:hypothetical protein